MFHLTSLCHRSFCHGLQMANFIVSYSAPRLCGDTICLIQLVCAASYALSIMTQGQKTPHVPTQSHVHHSLMEGYWQDYMKTVFCDQSIRSTKVNARSFLLCFFIDIIVAPLRRRADYGISVVCLSVQPSIAIPQKLPVGISSW